MQNKKILVTGGAGFIGSHLCETLLEQGHEVFCIDNFQTGSRVNISHLTENPRFHVICHDICFPYYCDVEEIYNLACPTAYFSFQNDPIQITKTNVSGAINMLSLAKSSNAKILQASSGLVYRDPILEPFHSNTASKSEIKACYEEGKRCAESLFFDYSRQYGVKVKVARLFSAYGPRMHPDCGQAISNFIIQALQNKSLTIYGSGKKERTFCYVSDLVDGMIRLMETDDSFAGPVNLGSFEKFSILELANKILKLTASKASINFYPETSSLPAPFNRDLSLAKTQLAWQPKIFLEEGLKKTIDYFKQAIEI